MMSIIVSFHLNLALLSFGLAFLGSYVAICLTEQLRSSYLHGEKLRWSIRTKWLIAMGVSFGGVGMWSVDQIMLASLFLEIRQTKSLIRFHFNFTDSLISLALCCILVTIGVVIASNDPMYAKSKAEIIESFVKHTANLSMTEIRQTKDSRMIWIIATTKPWILIFGGTIAAIGVVVMHYLNVQALVFDEKLELHRNGGLLFLSFVIAWIGCIVGFWILFRLLSIFPSRERLRVASAMLLAGTFGATFYIAIKSVKYSVNSISSVISTGRSYTLDYNLIILPAFIVLWFFIFYALSDTRRLIYKYRNYIQQHGHGLSNRRTTGLETSRTPTGRPNDDMNKFLPSSINKASSHEHQSGMNTHRQGPSITIRQTKQPKYTHIDGNKGDIEDQLLSFTLHSKPDRNDSENILGQMTSRILPITSTSPSVQMETSESISILNINQSGSEELTGSYHFGNQDCLLPKPSVSTLVP